MEKDKSVAEASGEVEVGLLLDEIVREGARRLLQAALEAEVQEFVDRHREVVDQEGRRHVVRNGHLPRRQVLTGAGPLEVEQPRVRDRRGASSEGAVTFSSSILPRYLRRSKSIDELIPWLYLKGISSQDMPSALEALLGPGAKGLSANVVTRLTAQWVEEAKVWSQRSLSDREYVYLWVDGVHFNVRLEEDRQCILVVIGATRDGHERIPLVLMGRRFVDGILQERSAA